MDMEMIKQIAIPILQKHGIEKAFIFGSYARGEQNENSDIDFLIEYGPNAKKSLFTRARIINELREALQKDVDVVTEKSLSKYFRRDVLRKKKVIM